jgi:hypothetical protein
VERGAGGFGTGSRGRRTLVKILVIKHCKCSHDNVMSDCSHPLEPVKAEAGVMRTEEVLLKD